MAHGQTNAAVEFESEPRQVAVTRLSSESTIWQAVREDIAGDPIFAATLQQLQEDMLASRPMAITEKYSIKHGCLMCKRQLYIPCQMKALQE